MTDPIISAEDVVAARQAERDALRRCGEIRKSHRTLLQFLNHAVEKVRVEAIKPDDIVYYLRSANWGVEPVYVKVTRVTDKTIIGDIVPVDDYSIRGTLGENEGPKTARISKGSWVTLDALPAERLPEFAAEVEFWKPYWAEVVNTRREHSRMLSLSYRQRRAADEQALRDARRQDKALKILANRHAVELSEILAAMP